jgi:hypothetical protein
MHPLRADVPLTFADYWVNGLFSKVAMTDVPVVAVHTILRLTDCGPSGCYYVSKRNDTAAAAAGARDSAALPLQRKDSPRYRPTAKRPAEPRRARTIRRVDKHSASLEHVNSTRRRHRMHPAVRVNRTRGNATRPPREYPTTFRLPRWNGRRRNNTRNFTRANRSGGRRAPVRTARRVTVPRASLHQSRSNSRHTRPPRRSQIKPTPAVTPEPSQRPQDSEPHNATGGAHFIEGTPRRVHRTSGKAKPKPAAATAPGRSRSRSSSSERTAAPPKRTLLQSRTRAARKSRRFGQHPAVVHRQHRGHRAPSSRAPLRHDAPMIMFVAGDGTRYSIGIEEGELDVRASC